MWRNLLLYIYLITRRAIEITTAKAVVTASLQKRSPLVTSDKVLWSVARGRKNEMNDDALHNLYQQVLAMEQQPWIETAICRIVPYISVR